MGTVRYTVIDGEMIAEKRNGVRKQYVPDSLGSTVALLDNTQTPTDTFTYWPYGEVASRTGTTPTPFQFVGTAGYRQDSASKTYVRARVLDTTRGRWLNEDPLALYKPNIFDENSLNLYIYVNCDPISNSDISGLAPTKKRRKPRHIWPPFPYQNPHNPPSCAFPCKPAWITCFNDKDKGPGDVAVYCDKNATAPRTDKCPDCENMDGFCKCQGGSLGPPLFSRGTYVCINGSNYTVNDCGCGQKVNQKPQPDNWIDVWIKDCNISYPNHWACVCPMPCNQMSDV